MTMEIGYDEIAELKSGKLTATLAAIGFPTWGTVEERRRRLQAWKAGGHEHYVRGHTLCARVTCRAMVTVMHVAFGQYVRVRCPRCGMRDKVGW
jgi:hypothetical protein